MTSLAQLEEQKTAMLGDVATWSPARLAYQPAPEQWSATEMFDHIVRTEDAIMRAASEGLAKPHCLRVRDRLGFGLLTSVFRSDRRVKVPSSAAQVLPQGGLAFSEVCARWEETRLALALLLASAPQSDTALGVFRHPVSGWMTLDQVLEFFSVHMTHHGFQLARLRAASQAYEDQTSGER